MRKPRVGITPDSRESTPYNQAIPDGYKRGVERAGGEWVVIPYHLGSAALLAVAQSLDGMIFTGGADVDPSRYGAEREAACGESVEIRDAMELRLMELALSRDLPILGICRGLQLINVALGGTLIQHINGHEQPEEGGFWHEVRVQSDTTLHSLVGEDRALVNSYHHQCVQKLAPGLTVSAIHVDGTIEAFEMPSRRFLMAVQWHPEMTLDADELSIKFFEALVGNC